MSPAVFDFALQSFRCSRPFRKSGLISFQKRRPMEQVATVQVAQMDQSIAKAFAKAEDGVTALEYALIAGIVAVSIVFSLTQFRDSLQGGLNNVATAISNAL
jgi:pilus assembly protein Flp/PilA